MICNEFICPVCNGLETLWPSCPRCLAAAEDCGKTSDFYGPYSPYRPIDDLKLTNGFADASAHQCVHTSYCPGCRAGFFVMVQEIIV